MTDDDSQAIAAQSWRFALRLYAMPQAADACLALQNHADVDVMLLIVALFGLSERRIALTAADIGRLDDRAKAWRQEIVRPLRALRTRLKSGPAPAPSQATEALRARIKEIELGSERVENDLLAAALPSAPAGAEITAASLEQAILRVIVCNRDPQLPIDSRLRSAIDILVGHAASMAQAAPTR